MNMETYKYFESIDLVLSEIFGCTEASGPQICNLEGMISPPYSQSSNDGVFYNQRYILCGVTKWWYAVRTDNFS